jgi:hypothetical protein
VAGVLSQIVHILHHRQSYNSYTTKKKLSSFRQCWKSVTEADPESDPNPDPTSDLTPFFSDFQDAKIIFFFIFFL